MGIMETDEWLLDSYDDPVSICERLKPYFKDSSPQDIHYYLTNNGMYHRPSGENKDIVDKMYNNHVWEIVDEQRKQLQTRWHGPDIPIFIFPADPQNRLVQRDFQGKAGITFPDKIFLFISDHNEKEDIQALFTHEYNHVCRMNLFSKKEANNRLIDSIIMEGLAEHAVSEQVGKAHLADWTSYYSTTQLDRFWKRWIKPNKDMPKFRRKHFDLLFGTGLYPKMLGYSVGFHLVGRYIQKHQSDSKKLLHIPSDVLADA